ncbi:hypothetical protein NQZ68_001399, partial [Dissostichus eleginoides]
MEGLPGGCNEQEGRARLSKSVFQSQVQRPRERERSNGCWYDRWYEVRQTERRDGGKKGTAGL